ncbi:MAG TPA: hypothetical protein VHC67_15050 [Gaiellaceae bacterium]|jgi:hypothetical protein|nr:hypothetical protein [Gaiellaceae bacterium]
MPTPFKKAIGVAMLLAPITGLVSALASPPLHGDTAAGLAEVGRHSDRFFVYALFITVSCWLFVVAVIGLVALVAERAPRLAVAGGALALIGTLVAVGDGTVELMYWAMGSPAADRAQMVALSDRYDGGTSLFFTLGGLALLAGLLVIAVVLWRQRLAPVWAAFGVPLFAVVNIVGFSMASNAVVALSNVLLLVVFAAFALPFFGYAVRAGRSARRYSTV